MLYQVEGNREQRNELNVQIIRVKGSHLAPSEQFPMTKTWIWKKNGVTNQYLRCLVYLYPLDRIASLVTTTSKPLRAKVAAVIIFMFLFEVTTLQGCMHHTRLKENHLHLYSKIMIWFHILAYTNWSFQTHYACVRVCKVHDFMKDIQFKKEFLRMRGSRSSTGCTSFLMKLCDFSRVFEVVPFVDHK